MATRHVNGRVLRDWSLAALSFSLLFLAIRSLDPRVNGLVTSIGHRPDAALGTAQGQLDSWVSAALGAIRDQTAGHTSLVLFTLAGVALVIVMLRIQK